MNIFILIMLGFACIGFIDRILGGKLGFSESFDDGLKTMGSTALSMVGFYCIAISFMQANASVITSLSIPFDPSIIIGSILAPDMGGFNIISELHGSYAMLVFAGIVLTSTLGCTISFQLPIFLSSIKKEEVSVMIEGLLYGIVTLPIVLIILALFLGLENIVVNLLPILVVCLVLIVGLLVNRKVTIQILSVFAYLIKALSIVLFVLVVAQVFFPQLTFTTPALIQEGMVIVLRMCIVVCGSMVLSNILLNKGKKYINKVATLLGTNDVAIVGLVLNLTSSLAMLPLFSRMDTKGKMINAAFSVSGAYVLGGQLGFVSSVIDSHGVFIYIFSKIVAGILAIIALVILNKGKGNEDESICE